MFAEQVALVFEGGQTAQATAAAAAAATPAVVHRSRTDVEMAASDSQESLDFAPHEDPTDDAAGLQQLPRKE